MKACLKSMDACNEGLTPSERYLSKLCRSSFLTLWSYPRIYRDQDTGNGRCGKEICDLLVVFGNEVIIFSDKNCQYKDTGKADIDWMRWFRKCVLASIKQAVGAERWIRGFPKRIFLDKECKKPFPFDIPDPSKVRFHVVVVARGIAKACAEQYGGSGSLMLNSLCTETDSHFNNPFTIGDVNPNGSFVHVFDDTSLDVVMRCLDTILDFVSYLIKRERLVRSSVPVYSAGEEEHLAYYLKNINKNNEHDFVFNEKVDCVSFSEGIWEEFCNNPQRKKQLEEDKISYFWDGLIESFANNGVHENGKYTIPPGIQTVESILRLMASENRFMRRLLSKSFFELLESGPRHLRSTRCVAGGLNCTNYVFLLLPQPLGMEHDEYRRLRRDVLHASCMALKVKFPKAQDIVGIATEPGLINKMRSEDAIYYNARNWTPKDQENALSIIERTGLLKSPKFSPLHGDEYPEV